MRARSRFCRCRHVVPGGQSGSGVDERDVGHQILHVVPVAGEAPLERPHRCCDAELAADRPLRLEVRVRDRDVAAHPEDAVQLVEGRHAKALVHGRAQIGASASRARARRAAGSPITQSLSGKLWLGGMPAGGGVSGESRRRSASSPRGRRPRSPTGATGVHTSCTNAPPMNCWPPASRRRRNAPALNTCSCVSPSIQRTSPPASTRCRPERPAPLKRRRPPRSSARADRAPASRSSRFAAWVENVLVNFWKSPYRLSAPLAAVAGPEAPARRERPGLRCRCSAAACRCRDPRRSGCRAGRTTESGDSTSSSRPLNVLCCDVASMSMRPRSDSFTIG